jgi:hypothetical protein
MVLEQREKPMAYGHAERNLAVIRQLEAETSQFLASLRGEDQRPSEDEIAAIAENVPAAGHA